MEILFSLFGYAAILRFDLSFPFGNPQKLGGRAYQVSGISAAN
jgi:hypothetical protein